MCAHVNSQPPHCRARLLPRYGARHNNLSSCSSGRAGARASRNACAPMRTYTRTLRARQRYIARDWRCAQTGTRRWGQSRRGRRLKPPTHGRRICQWRPLSGTQAAAAKDTARCEDGALWPTQLVGAIYYVGQCRRRRGVISVIVVGRCANSDWRPADTVQCRSMHAGRHTYLAGANTAGQDVNFSFAQCRSAADLHRRRQICHKVRSAQSARRDSSRVAIAISSGLASQHQRSSC